MTIKLYKPTTPSRRHSSIVKRSDLSKDRPQRSLRLIKKNKAGRSHGKITCRHRGGGAKRYYRLVDFRRNKFDISAKVISLEYDPNRTTYLALVCYIDGAKRYILASKDLKVGDQVCSSQNKIEFKQGNRMPLKFIPVGTMVYNLEFFYLQGGKVVRSAGTGATILAQKEKFTDVKMPSNEIRKFPNLASATIGQVANFEHKMVRLGKAGRKRHLGWRPTVRGKAMNPCDHPHGGGEGHNPIGLKHPKTPWGKPALGPRTRRKKKWSNKFIIKRRAKKRRG